MPSIEPEPNRLATMDSKHDVRTKFVAHFNQLTPKLRASSSRGKQRARRGEVFSFKDIKPHHPRGRSENPPPPLKNQAFIHDGGVDDAKPPKALRPTHKFPFNQSIFSFVISSVPVESTTMFIETRISTFREPIKSHQEHGEGGETSISEANLPGRCVIPATPRHDPVTHFIDQRFKLFST